MSFSEQRITTAARAVAVANGYSVNKTHKVLPPEFEGDMYEVLVAGKLQKDERARIIGDATEQLYTIYVTEDLEQGFVGTGW